MAIMWSVCSCLWAFWYGHYTVKTYLWALICPWLCVCVLIWYFSPIMNRASANHSDRCCQLSLSMRSLQPQVNTISKCNTWSTKTNLIQKKKHKNNLMNFPYLMLKKKSCIFLDLLLPAGVQSASANISWMRSCNNCRYASILSIFSALMSGCPSTPHARYAGSPSHKMGGSWRRTARTSRSCGAMLGLQITGDGKKELRMWSVPSMARLGRMRAGQVAAEPLLPWQFDLPSLLLRLLDSALIIRSISNGAKIFTKNLAKISFVSQIRFTSLHINSENRIYKYIHGQFRLLQGAFFFFLWVGEEQIHFASSYCENRI